MQLGNFFVVRAQRLPRRTLRQGFDDRFFAHKIFGGSEFNRFVQLRQLRLQLMPLFNQFRQKFALRIFPVRQHHARLDRRDGGEPRQQIRLPRVRAKTAERVDLRLHRDFFAEDAHDFFTVHQPPSERLGALIADDDDVRHLVNWLESMQTRTQPNATVDHGFSHSLVCIMAAQSYWSGKKLYWDPQNQQIVDHPIGENAA